MNEKVKQAQETLLNLSGLALKYLVNNFHYNSNEYANGKLEIGNLTDKLRITLNDFDRYHESQQDLIKSKDEYIAKLCNDRAELKEEITELRDFAKEIAKLPRFLETNYINDNNYKIRNSKYNENERCWLYQDIRCSTDDKNGWFLNERDGAMVFSKERAEELIEKFKNWGFKGAEDLIIVLEYKQAHDRYVLFKKVLERYGKKED